MELFAGLVADTVSGARDLLAIWVAVLDTCGRFVLFKNWYNRDVQK